MVPRPGGNLLDRLLNDDKKDTLTWYWQLKTLPDAPESRYLYKLLASNEFQEGLKNYRELKFMSRNLDDWREDVSAFDDMLDTRQQAYNQEVPKADAVMLLRIQRERFDSMPITDQEFSLTQVAWTSARPAPRSRASASSRV